MTRERICLVSPGHLSTNPRLVKEASALSEAGYDVRIVCGSFLPRAREFDSALVDPRWQVSYVRFGPAEAPRRTYFMQTLRRHGARTLARLGTTNLRVLEAAHAPAGAELAKAALDIPADLYIAHYVAALPAAACAAHSNRAHYAFDAEDFHLDERPEGPQNKLEKRITHAIESRYLPGAAYITAASPMIADAYAATYGIRRPTVLLNVFSRRNGPKHSSTRGSMTPSPSLYWFSQTIGPGRGLETAIEAISTASSNPFLHLRGTPSAGYEQQLRALAASFGVSSRLVLHPPLAPCDLERDGAAYDIGYSGEVGFSRNNAIALANKLFSYLCSGIPILASDIPSHKDISPSLGKAMILFQTGNAGSLAAAIDNLLLNPAHLRAARACAWRLGQERYCWEEEQQTLLKAVGDALAAR